MGLVTFDNQIRQVIRPSSNPSHLKQLLHVMETTVPQAKTATGPIFHELAQRLDRRGVVLVLSDLFDDVPSMLAGLKHFRHRRHDVTVFHTLDAAELDFSFRRLTLFKGLEQFPEVLAEPRAAPSVPEEIPRVSGKRHERLPPTSSGLSADAHRRAARCYAFQFSCYAPGEDKVKLVQ